MAAGTVISGGFPGRVAREVHPNQKCEGCLHYERQAGRTGVCTIGLRPDNCGDGEAPEVSYAPIASGAGSYLPDMSNHGAHAPEVDPQHVGGLYGSGSTRPVAIQQVTLGEEHVHIVKSVLGQHADLQKSQCLRCSMRGAHGTSPHNVDPQPCTCKPIEAATVAKAVASRMSNAARARIPLDSLTEWVREVVKAGFQLPAPRTTKGVADALSDALAQMGVQVGGRSDDHADGHLRPAARKPAPTAEHGSVAKSFYSDEWINQFRGTPLFDEARKLCEHELQMEEDELERTAERLKHERATRAALDKLPKLDSEDWQSREARRTKLRIAKQRLVLKLAGLHQEKFRVSKSEDLEKAIDNTKHSHVVTGKLAPHGVGASGRKAARAAVDRLDNKYGAAAHTAARNPNYRPKTLKWEKTSAYGDGGHVAEAGHGTYVHTLEPHNQHTVTYYPHGQGKEGALHGGTHSSPAAAHAAAETHHQKTIGG